MTINVIIGPPCAGKSTYISDKSIAGDVLIDYDKIAMALGSESSHNSDGSIRSMALMLRFSAVQKIINGIDSDSWVIHTNPSAGLVKQYIDSSAVFSVIDPGKDICIERAKQDGRPEGTLDAIDNWYDNKPDLTGANIKDSLGLTILADLRALIKSVKNYA